MKKKYIIRCLVAVIILVGSYNIFLIKISSDFKNYLTMKYPEKPFILSKVKYSPLLSFNARFKFEDEDFDFCIYLGAKYTIIDDYPDGGTPSVEW